MVSFLFTLTGGRGSVSQLYRWSIGEVIRFLVESVEWNPVDLSCQRITHTDRQTVLGNSPTSSRRMQTLISKQGYIVESEGYLPPHSELASWSTYPSPKSSAHLTPSWIIIETIITCVHNGETNWQSNSIIYSMNE
jgi:hypothetical protein